MRAALYLRVSTASQTVDNQRLELERVAQQRAWTIVEVYEDAGFSGAKGRDKRPGFDRLLKDANRGTYDIAMAWSVDRLGRSLPHLVGFLADLMASGRNLYLHQQGLDTSTPSGRAMFQMSGVFAEFEREMTRERVSAGLARAKQRGKRLGRPRTKSSVEARIVALRTEGMAMLRIGRELGVGTSVVQRVLGASKHLASMTSAE